MFYKYQNFGIILFELIEVLIKVLKYRALYEKKKLAVFLKIKKLN